MTEIDPRLMTISIEINGKVETFNQDFNIAASGVKFANENQDQCEITLTNLKKDTRDYLLSETTPYNLLKKPKTVTVQAGRVSYGLSLIYSGQVVSSHPSQPPDISIKLRCASFNFQKNLFATNQASQISFKSLAQGVASSLGIGLKFEAQDKNISNYTYSGALLGQVNKLSEMGNVSAYIDNNTLVVKTINVPLNNSLSVLNMDTGMIGIPQITEWGIKATFLLNNTAKLGGRLRIESKIYLAANGDYTIYKLGFQLASRDTPFYYIAEGWRL